MLPKTLRRNPGRVRAVVYAVLVHAAVVAMLVVSWRWSAQPTMPAGKVVQAVMVPEASAPKPKEPENHKQEEADKRAKELKELEEARKNAETEKQRQAELKEKHEEEKKQQEEHARQESEKKKKTIETEKKRSAALEKKAELAKKKEEAKDRQKHAEQTLQQQLAAEEKQRLEAAHAARAATEVDKYKALIRQKVSRSWNRPVGAQRGLKCVVSVSLTPGGEVLRATVVRSSGNLLFDRSVENAVYKAAPMPLPEDPRMFSSFREIEFLFSPEE